MAFDHSLRDAQVARIAEHAAGERVRFRFGEQTNIAALTQRDRQAGTDPTRSLGTGLFIVTIARSAVALPLPRVGQHFSASDGRTFRIQEDRTIPYDPALVYACISSV